MTTANLVIGMLVWLEIKHFVADYLLQSGWILRGKGDVRMAGGYVHAGLHAIGSLPIYFVAGLGGGVIAGLTAGEFAIHYLIDFSKVIYSRAHPSSTNSRAFWAVHGADQLLHHLTYCGLLFVIVLLRD